MVSAGSAPILSFLSPRPIKSNAPNWMRDSDLKKREAHTSTF